MQIREQFEFTEGVIITSLLDMRPNPLREPGAMRSLGN
jgi:hypothetical protein